MRDGVVSHRHTNGNGIYLPAASTSAMSSTTNSIVVVSNSQKQSVSDAIQNVALPPSAAPTLYKVARREFAGAKVHLFNEFITFNWQKKQFHHVFLFINRKMAQLLLIFRNKSITLEHLS